MHRRNLHREEASKQDRRTVWKCTVRRCVYVIYEWNIHLKYIKFDRLDIQMLLFLCNFVI